MTEEGLTLDKVCSRYYATLPPYRKLQHSDTFADVLPEIQEGIRALVRSVLDAAGVELSDYPRR